ncbi:hypothetical protein [Paraclostridium bifermentans]|uniref:hypothetical protein n=1 Tax=Paraclostridium bifermentans TaxID=1490 RepID=UPI00214A5AD5|nr:hypothetical protein [Paraclostridium bifermentans]MCR1877267.1 hypothetical protein [Paraclostridium bifermentans]
MVIVSLLMVLFIIGCIYYLQEFLSKKKSKVPGLILPGVAFLNSLGCLLQATTFKIGLTAFISTSIPTILLLGIYLSCRKKVTS